MDSHKVPAPAGCVADLPWTDQGLDSTPLLEFSCRDRAFVAFQIGSLRIPEFVQDWTV